MDNVLYMTPLMTGNVCLLPRLRPDDHEASAQEGPALPPLCHAGDIQPKQLHLQYQRGRQSLLIQVMKDYPGVPGLFVAGVFSGALSTVSSGLNSLAAVTLRCRIIFKLILKI